MFRFRHAYIEKSLTHTHALQERNLHDWHQEKNEKKSQRINVSVVTQNITDEVKLQVQ